MTKKNWWKLLCLGIATLCLSGCSLLENLFLTHEEVPEFSFSGYVMADGKALSGATVDCGISTTQTDEKGYYKFSGINNVVQVSVEKDGYLFARDLIFVNGVSSEVNFEGYKLFDKSGIVKNNNVAVSNVDILATSENGEFKTKSNEYGEFYLKDLAGQVKIVATKDGFNFFKSSFTIDKEDDVIISGLTDILGAINVDVDDYDISDFVLKVNNEEIAINSDLTFVALNVEPGDVISLSSSAYFIENSIQTISSDITDVVFNCQKYYDVTGSVLCGNEKLQNVTLKCGDYTISSPNGDFKFENIYGERVITATANNFAIENKNVNVNTEYLNIQATTTISGVIKLDSGSNFEDIHVMYDGQNVSVDRFGRFSVSGIKFGDKLTFASDNYFVVNEIEIVNRENLNINAYKLFNLSVQVLADGESVSGASVAIDGNIYNTDDNGCVLIANLYGNTNFTVSKDGYKFEDCYNVNYSKNDIAEVIVNGFELYNINGQIKSGDVAISGGQVLLNGASIDIASDGAFVLNNLYGTQKITLVSSGYNSKDVTLTKDNLNILEDLSYNISGQITCGKNGVEEVQVFGGGKSDTSDTNGEFELKDIIGSATITCSKTWYAFPKNIVSIGQDLLIKSTYSIEGEVSKKKDDAEDEMENLTNFKIVLIDKYSGEMKTTYTNENGIYEFSELTSEYALVYDMSSSLRLQPSMYEINGGGNFDFSNNGYSFGGKITCGDEPLAGVKLTIGNVQVSTDEDGEYSFPLVTKSGAITIEKEGYTFVANGHSGSASESFADRTDINYSATYKVVGVVKSGNVCLSGVNINIGDYSTITDSNGTFQISGLTGENDITLELGNYKFDGIKKVNAYASLNYVATFDVNVSVISGDIKLAGARVFVNNNVLDLLTNELGLIRIENLSVGDTISFELDGYEIERKTFESCVENLAINSTYMISGQVSNCGIPLNNVKVMIANSNIFVLTNGNGEFTLSGIAGSQELVLEKDGFNFDSVNICGAETLNIMSKFDVEGVVKVGGKSIAGVTITAGKYSTITDKDGKFKVTGLTTITIFTFEKTGYDFGSGVEVSTPEPLEIEGTYKLSGKVKSGDLLLSGVVFSVSGKDDVESDENGLFELIGLSGKTTVKVSFDGYNSKEITYEDFTSNIIINLDYNVTINFSGTNDYSGITISANSKQYACNSNTITIPNLKGETIITLSKENCYFSPTDNNSFKVTKGVTKDIVITKLFSANGTIKTSSGVAVAYATVYAGKNSTITDENGKYSFAGLSGEPTLKVVLPYNENSAYTSDLEVLGRSIKTDGTYDVVIPDKTFAVNFLNYAYDNLRYAMSYQIFGSGTVVASPTGIGAVAGDQTQSVSVIYKQDALGNKIFQNLNKGKKVDIAGVDPNVSLLSVFYTDNEGVRRVRYNQLTNIDFTQNDGIPQYVDSWTETDVNSYKENFGVDYNGFSPYVINKNTIKNVSGLSLSDNNYTFTLDLNCTPSAGAYTYYEKLMKTMCPQQDLSFFSNITLTFTITKSGYLRQMVINENYQVTSSGFDAPTKANITYDFIINSLTEKISNIDISTPSSVQKSLLLGQETPKETLENVSVINYNYTEEKINKNISCDIVAFKREEIL